MHINNHSIITSIRFPMSAAYVFSVAFLAAFLISKYQSQYLLLPCNESLSIHYRSLQGMKRNLVFFSPDIHDGTRCDLALSLYHLNQSIIFASRTRKMEFPRGEMVLSNSRSWDYFLCRGWIKLFPSFLVRSFLNSCYGLPFLSLVHTGRPRAK